MVLTPKITPTKEAMLHGYHLTVETKIFFVLFRMFVISNYHILFIINKWERLSDPQIWMDAATQMFFTLSLGFGALISFASYMPLKNNCVRDAYTVVLINCGTSLFAGIVVFSILGHRELVTGNPVDQVREK